jgi:hypothetical protein
VQSLLFSHWHAACPCKWQAERQQSHSYHQEELFVEPSLEHGAKVNLTKPIRSAKTGMLLPRQGTLVSVTENLGRTLLLVVFENGHHEYLFDHEVEVNNGYRSLQ